MPALMRQYSALRLLRVTAACIIMKNYCIPELSTKIRILLSLMYHLRNSCNSVLLY